MHRFLDVGSGSGYIAACAAFLVNQSGSVTSIDIRPGALDMSQTNIKELRAANQE